MKHTNSLSTLLLFVVCTVCLAGCTGYYNSVYFSEVSTKSINAASTLKPFFTLQNSQSVFSIDDLEIKNDTVFGKLSKTSLTDHSPFKDKFRRKNSYTNPAQYLHMFTSASLSEGPFALPISQINAMQVHEKDVGLNVLATSGLVLAGTAVVGAGVLIWIIFEAINSCNCPYVATIQPDSTVVFEGSIFPGAMFKSLTRDDKLILKHTMANEKGEIEIKVFNELEEVQYLDKLALLEIDMPKPHLGITNDAQLISFDNETLPSAATSQSGLEVLNKMNERDQINYNFDDIGTEDKLNSIELTFDKHNLNNNAQLIIRGQQSKLLEQTAEYFFQQFGTEFPHWVKKMNTVDKEKYDQNAIEQGISLNAYVKVNDEWQYIGSYENVGTVAPRDVCLPINLKNSGEQIKIKLEAAHGFWSIDQVSLTSDWTTDLEVNELPLVSAIDQDGKDVVENILATDQNYVTQNSKGTFTLLKFKSENASSNKAYALSANGYYNHSRQYTHEPNKKGLKQMKRMPLSSHYLARLIYLTNTFYANNTN